jgi:hypothetical protein
MMEEQTASVPVRVTERQKTTSDPLMRWRSASFGLLAIGSKAPLVVAKMVVMYVSSEMICWGGERVAVAVFFFF